MPWPWVSREQLERVEAQLAYERRLHHIERARGDRYLEQLLQLRREGFTPQKPGHVASPPDPEVIAAKRARDEWVENFVENAVAEGHDPRAARVEALRLREELEGQHVPVES